MKFTVIFTTKGRNTVRSSQFIDRLTGPYPVEYRTEEQEPQYIGLNILDRYRDDINDQNVTIEDIPDLLERREDPTIIEIDEELARKSGRFKHRTKFKCWIKQDVMEKFEKIENVSDDENEKLTIIVDKKHLIDAWEKVGFPEEWVSQTEKKNEKE